MRLISKETAWEGSFLRTVLLTYKDHNGHMRTWEAVERINTQGVVIVIPVTASGEFILIRQYRPVMDNYVIEFPAGLNDRGESSSEAAGRELVEETGYFSNEIIFLAEGPVSLGVSIELVSVFLANNAVVASDELKRRFPPDDTENIEAVCVPMQDIYDFLDSRKQSGDYFDLKIFGVIELAKKYLERCNRKF
ncbi:MAG: NUDIX hydrolase [Dissulfurispiraceae bacterium]|jgi:8-oxo-dGTP pyrophosphatase MutT (NUDIX family)|nr:NUDIX hydrolase [Dissulfurispiraceae bacterium]